MNRYYVNIRTPEGENPAFVEITQATFIELAKGERRAVKFDWNHGGKSYSIATYHGRGEFDQDGDTHQYLQYMAVDLIELESSEEDKAVHVVARPDKRPAGCRFRLADEGKPYPKSGCNACGARIGSGLGRECSHSKN